MIEKPAQKEVNISTLPEKQAALVLMNEQGIKKAEIAKVLNYKESSVNTLSSKLKRFTFTGNVKTQKAAFKTISRLAEGKTPRDSEIKEVKDSTALQAARYISDHNDPVVQHIETKNRTVIAVVDYEKYKNK